MIQDPRSKNSKTKIQRILILNWRDIKNPTGGGAEILTHELAKGWVRAGYEVIVFSSWFIGAKKTEVVDGVRIVRRGKWWNVHLFALFYYLSNKKDIDVIIDEVHWFPFFAAVYARDKTIVLTCEVATKLFPKLFPPVISHIFQGIEKLYLLLYRNVPTFAISESTKTDLVRAHVNPNKITVLPMGLIVPKKIKKYSKEKNPTFIYLARLNKQKGIMEAINTFALIRKSLGSSVLGLRKSSKEPRTKNYEPKLWVVGSGEENLVAEVKNLVKKYGLEKDVKFFGFVTEEKKFELLSRAHILLVPSVHEGWGLTVPEAATQKTPSIVYNVPGLRDIVKNNITGIIVKKNTPEMMADEAVKLIKDKKKYAKFQMNGLKAIKDMEWNKAVDVSLRVIKSI